MTNMYRFNQYLTLANQLASVATKDDLAECARLLAINVAHYQSIYGSLPLDETLEMAYAESPNQTQIDLMAEYSYPKEPSNIAGYTPQITTLMRHLKLF